MNLKQNIIRILNEEVDNKKSKLIKYIDRFGLIAASKLLGSYQNLRQTLKGTEYLNRDNMVKTIQDYFKQPNRLRFLDLNNDLGLEHIELEKSNHHLITLSGLFKGGYVIEVYEKDDYDEFELVHDTTMGFDDVDYKNEPLLKTIHLYELTDAIMERYEDENKR
jgi:hypothetical protein